MKSFFPYITIQKLFNGDGEDRVLTISELTTFLEKTDQIARNTLKGNSKIAPMSLIPKASVRPTILNGSAISHNNGKRKIMASANGQQSTNRMHQRRTARINFIDFGFGLK